MDKRNQIKQQLSQGAQTNVTYWRQIKHYITGLNSCQKEVSAASSANVQTLNLSQELTIARNQSVMDHAKNHLHSDLYRPNASTATNANSSFQIANSAAKLMNSIFKGPVLNRSHSVSQSINNSSVLDSNVNSSKSASYLSHSITSSSSIPSRASSVSTQLTSSISQSSTTSHSSVSTREIIDSQSKEMSYKVSSILTQPMGSANRHQQVNIQPIKVRYYDIDSNKLIKSGTATGEYGQMINVADLVPLPKGYHPYFYQKLYYNVDSHPKTAVVFITDHQINLKISRNSEPVVHSLSSRSQSSHTFSSVSSNSVSVSAFSSSTSNSIESESKSSKVSSSASGPSSKLHKRYLSKLDFEGVASPYLLIKKDLFIHSNKNLSKSSRDKKLINGEIIQIKRLTQSHGITLAELPDQKYITARKDFVAAFKI